MIKNENISFLEKKFNENKLSHVFLVETDDKLLALEDIKSLIKIMNCPNKYSHNCSLCNICNLINNNSLPTLKIIFPDGQNIKKSQMEELKADFSCIPIISKYNTYIINDAEKFNSSSANTMLKFIEEPENNIVGFLITNNKENVIDTIKSRCEIVKAYYNSFNEKITDEKLVDLALEYIYNLEIEQQKGIVYNKKIVDLKYERSQYILFFKYILSVYIKLLNNEVINDKLKDINLSTLDIIKRINLVNDVIDKLNYNVNINLLLDSFALELEV